MNEKLENTTAPLAGATIIAKKLGLGLSTVYAHAKADEIPHYQIGGKLLFSLPEIESWLATKKRG